jgi:hypothetical protein
MPFIVSAFVRVSWSLWARHLHSSKVLNARKKVERRPRNPPRKDEDNEEDLQG